MSRFRDKAGEFNETSTVILGRERRQQLGEQGVPRAARHRVPDPERLEEGGGRQYGVLNEESGFALRTTFVVDTAGVVRHIDQGRDAMDPAGAVGVCRLLKKGK